MKNREKGITLIALVITVSVLLMLTGITFAKYKMNKNHTVSQVLNSEIAMVKNAVLERKTQADLTRTDYSKLPGENNRKSQVEIVADYVTLLGNDGEYKLLNPENLEKLGITNVVDTYIVNYRTGEVINKDQYGKYEEAKLYVYGTK